MKHAASWRNIFDTTHQLQVVLSFENELLRLLWMLSADHSLFFWVQKRLCYVHLQLSWHRRSSILCSIFDARSHAAETSAEGGAAAVARPELLMEIYFVWWRWPWMEASQGFNSLSIPEVYFRQQKLWNTKSCDICFFSPRFGYVPTFEELINANNGLWSNILYSVELVSGIMN